MLAPSRKGPSEKHGDGPECDRPPRPRRLTGQWPRKTGGNCSRSLFDGKSRRSSYRDRRAFLCGFTADAGVVGAAPRVNSLSTTENPQESRVTSDKSGDTDRRSSFSPIAVCSVRSVATGCPQRLVGLPACEGGVDSRETRDEGAGPTPGLSDKAFTSFRSDPPTVARPGGGCPTSSQGRVSEDVASPSPFGLSIEEPDRPLPRRGGGGERACRRRLPTATRHVIDSTALEPPHRSSAARPPSLTPPATVTTPVTTVDFTVTYNDDVGIDPATLGVGDPNDPGYPTSPADLTVNGPNGYSITAVYLRPATPPGVQPSLAATYRIIAPDGRFTSAANGTYTVSVNGSAVADGDGNHVASGSLGSFQVNLPAPAGGDFASGFGTDFAVEATAVAIQRQDPGRRQRNLRPLRRAGAVRGPQPDLLRPARRHPPVQPGWQHRHELRHRRAGRARGRERGRRLRDPAPAGRVVLRRRLVRLSRAPTSRWT